MKLQLLIFPSAFYGHCHPWLRPLASDLQPQSVSMTACICHFTTAAQRETALSMLAADAACRWSKVEKRGGERRGRLGRRHRGAACSCEMLLQLWEQELHGKSHHWEYRWKLKVEYERLECWRVDTKEENSFDKVKKSKRFIVIEQSDCHNRNMFHLCRSHCVFALDYVIM